MATATTIPIKPGRLFIGGKWADAASGKTFSSINPATGEALTTLAEADERDADAAVAAARKAFESGPGPEIRASDLGRLVWGVWGGNTGGLKPAPWSSLTALRLAEICQDAGLPEGVLNVVTGSTRELGRALVRHAGVDKIAFTGSTATGQEIMRESAATVKR